MYGGPWIVSSSIQSVPFHSHVSLCLSAVWVCVAVTRITPFSYDDAADLDCAGGGLAGERCVQSAPSHVHVSFGAPVPLKSTTLPRIRSVATLAPDLADGEWAGVC
jgi:hypothetical protein